MWLTAPMQVLTDATPRAHWMKLTDAALAPMQQRWIYGVAVATMGGRIARLEVRDGGETVALVQAVRRRMGVPVSLITRGPIWVGDPDPDARAKAMLAIRTHLGGLVLVTPRIQDPAMNLARMSRVMTGSTLGHIALDGSLRHRLHGKWRNRLVRAEAAEVTVRASHSQDDIQWLLDADARQQKTRRYRALPPSFTGYWHRNDRKSVTMLTAERDGHRLAAMLFLTHGSTATYHVGWTSDEGRAVSAHNLLLWQAAERLRAKGVRQLDLGLIDTETAPGLARFKLGAGAMPVPTGGTWLGW